MQINEGLDLFEGDIELGSSEMNTQTDLSFRWPGARLYVDVGADLDHNVVGVLHQTIRELEAKSQVRFYTSIIYTPKYSCEVHYFGVIINYVNIEAKISKQKSPR